MNAHPLVLLYLAAVALTTAALLAPFARLLLHVAALLP